MARRRGFTLIELVMVVTILSLLASMVIPRFIDLQGRARYSSTQGSLGAIRAAISIEYASNAANDDTSPIPDTISANMFQDQTIPLESVTGTTTNTVTIVASAGSVTDTGGWAYDSVAGRAWVNHSAYTSW